MIDTGVVAGAPNTRIYLDQFDMSGFANAAEATPFEQELLDARTFNSSGSKWHVGNYMHTHSQAALWDGNASQSDAIYNALVGVNTNHYLGEAWGANSAGAVIYESVVALKSTPIKAAAGQLITMSAEFEGNGPVARSVILGNSAVAPTTATGAMVTSGALQGVTNTSQTYQSVIRALGGASFSALTVQIQEASSTAVGDYTDIAGMSSTFAGPGGVARVTTTGATKAYKRALVKVLTGSGAQLVVTGGQVST